MHVMQAANITGPTAFPTYQSHGIHLSHSGQHSHPSSLLPPQHHTHVTHHSLHAGDIVSQIHQPPPLPSNVSAADTSAAMYASPVTSYCGNIVATPAGFTPTANLEANSAATLLNSAAILTVHAAAAPPQPTQISVLTTAVPGLVNSQGESIFVPQATFSTPALLTNGDNPPAVVRVSTQSSILASERHSQKIGDENCIGTSDQYRVISSNSIQDVFPDTHFHLNQEDPTATSSQAAPKCDGVLNSQSFVTRASSDEQAPVCRDFLRNACRRGKRCRFFHPPHGQFDQVLLQQRYGSGLAHLEALVCHDYQNQGCFRFNCRFLHLTQAEEEHYKLTGELTPQAKQQLLESGVPITGADGEPPVCKNFLNGQCHRGSRCKYRHVSSVTPQTTSAQTASLNPSEPFSASFSIHASTMESTTVNTEAHPSATYSQLLPVSAAVFTGSSSHIYNSLVPPGQHIPLPPNHVLGSSMNAAVASSSQSNPGAAATTTTLIVPASMATLQPLGATSLEKTNHHAVLTPTQVAIIPTVSVTGAVQDAPSIVTITNAAHSLPCSAVHMNASGDLLTVVPALSLTATHQGSAHFHPHQNTSAVMVSGISAAPASAYCAPPPPGTTTLLSVSTNASCCHSTYPVYVATTSSGSRGGGTLLPTQKTIRAKRNICTIATVEDSSSRCSSSTAPMSPCRHTLCDSEDEAVRSIDKLSPQALNASSASSTASSYAFSSTDPTMKSLNHPSSLSEQLPSSTSARPSEHRDNRAEHSELGLISTSTSTIPHRPHRKKLRLQLFSESDSGTGTPSPSWDTEMVPGDPDPSEPKSTSSGILDTISSPSSSGLSSLKTKKRSQPTKIFLTSNSSTNRVRLLAQKNTSSCTFSVNKDVKVSRSTSRSSSLEMANNRSKSKVLSKSNSSRRATVHHRHQVYMLRQMDELHRENRELRRALDDVRTANNDLRTANQVLLEQNVRLRTNTAHHLLSDASAVPVTAVAMAAPHFLPANALTAASMCSILPAMTVLTTSNSHVANTTDPRHHHLQRQSIVQNTHPPPVVNTTSLHQHFSAAMASSTPVAIYSTSVHHNPVGTGL